jgi:hypothetical protein
MTAKKKGRTSNNPVANIVLVGKWLLVLLVLIACCIFAAHHIYQFMGPKSRPNAGRLPRRGRRFSFFFSFFFLLFFKIITTLLELVSAGYYGQKIHVHCLYASQEENSTIFVLHHDNHMTCVNYAKLQKGLLAAGYSSCCVERPGFGLSPLPHSISESVSLKGKTKKTLLFCFLVYIFSAKGRRRYWWKPCCIRREMSTSLCRSDMEQEECLLGHVINFLKLLICMWD